MRYSTFAVLAALVTSPAAFAGACGDQPGTRELTLPVRVLTEHLEAIGGLQARNFRLKQGRKPLAICGVSHAIQPTSVGILLDTSGSMLGVYQSGPRMMEAAVSRMLDISRDDDEYFLEYVNDVAHMQCLFSCDRQRIRNGLKVNPKGKTALIDGLYLALHGMSKAHRANRALVLISDCGDNNSLYNLGELQKALAEGPVPIFLMAPSTGIFDWRPQRSVIPEEFAAFDFTKLVSRSGGYTVIARNPPGAEAAIAHMVMVMRAPYELSFAVPVRQDIRSLHGLSVEVTGVHPAPSAFYGIVHDTKSGEAYAFR